MVEQKVYYTSFLLSAEAVAVVSLSYERWCRRLLTRVDIDQDHSHQGLKGPKARGPSQVLVNVCLIANCTKLLYTDKIWRVGVLNVCLIANCTKYSIFWYCTLIRSEGWGCYQVSGSMFGYRKVTATNLNNYVLADLWRHCIHSQ